MGDVKQELIEEIERRLSYVEKYLLPLADAEEADKVIKTGKVSGTLDEWEAIRILATAVNRVYQMLLPDDGQQERGKCVITRQCYDCLQRESGSECDPDSSWKKLHEKIRQSIQVRQE